jgi:phosphocarrier protein HPr
MPTEEAMAKNFRPPMTRQMGGTGVNEANAADGIYQCLAEVTIINKRGLHARASATFVKTAEQFDAEVFVTKDGHTVNGGSIMSLLMLGASVGSSILIVTDGPEAEEALEALTTLVESGFNEKE